MLHALFVRHAESEWNRLGIIQGQHLDAPGLSSAGDVQARALAEDLAGCGAQRLVTSSLRRARETAAAIGTRLLLEPVVDAAWDERGFGSAEGVPFSSFAPGTFGVADGQVVDADRAPEGGESLRDVYHRAELALAELAPGAIVVTHAVVLRCVLSLRDGISCEDMVFEPLTNASAYRVELEVDRPGR